MRGASLTCANVGMQLNKGRRERVVGADHEVGFVLTKLGENVKFGRIGFRADRGFGHVWRAFFDSD